MTIYCDDKCTDICFAAVSGQINMYLADVDTVTSF